MADDDDDANDMHNSILEAHFLLLYNNWWIENRQIKLNVEWRMVWLFGTRCRIQEKGIVCMDDYKNE